MFYICGFKLFKKLKRYFTATIFLAILACFLWSTAFVGIKLGLKFTTPLNFAGIRFFLSGLMIIPFTGGIGKYFREVKLHYRHILNVSLFQTFLLYSLFYTGISMASASVSAIIVGAGPLFVALMANFIIDNDKLTGKKLLSIFIGFSGIILIAVDRFEINWEKGREFWGILILVIANIAGSFGNILVSKNKSAVSPLVLNSAQIMFGGLGIFVLSLFLEDHNFGIKPLEYYLSLTYLSLLSAIAFSIWFVLLKRPGVKVSELNIWKFLIPVFGALLSWLILPDEYPESIQVTGMMCIAFSLVLLNKPNLVSLRIFFRRTLHK